jgi:hypothetical protein
LSAADYALLKPRPEDPYLFGDLIAVGEIRQGRWVSRYICVCKCGTRDDFPRKALQAGRRTACLECQPEVERAMPDPTKPGSRLPRPKRGDKFGKLSVEAVQAVGKHGRVRVDVRCDCTARFSGYLPRILNLPVWACPECTRKDSNGLGRYGRLVAKGFFRENYGKFCDCLCDCGVREAIKYETLLNYGRRACSVCQPQLLGNTDLPDSVRVEAGLRKEMKLYRKGADSRNLLFALSLDDVRRLMSGTCFYCGSQPARLLYNHKGLLCHGALVNGIDRRDNRIGYVVENCVSCCAACNRMKGAACEKEFLGRVWDIANRHPTPTPINDNIVV